MEIHLIYRKYMYFQMHCNILNLGMQSNLAFNNQYKLFVLVSLQQYQWINEKLICLFCCFEYKTWVVNVYTCTWS